MSAPRGSRKLWRVEERFRGSASEGLAWCEELLSGYDLSKLSRLSVRDGSARKVPPGVWGTCYYPDPRRNILTYRITCSIKGPFPVGKQTRKSPLYANEDGTYPPLPHGLLSVGREFVSTSGGKTRRWVRLYGVTILCDEDEAIVWIIAHEAFHFLRRTRQIPGRNVEIAADRFADEAKEHFVSGCSPERFRALQEERASLAQKERARKTGGKPS